MLEFLGDFDSTFLIKFAVLYIPFVVLMLMFAPGLKWKLLFSFAGIIGIWSALAGKSISLHKKR